MTLEMEKATPKTHRGSGISLGLPSTMNYRKKIVLSVIACIAGTSFALSIIQIFSHSDSWLAYSLWLLILPMGVVGLVLDESRWFWPAFIAAQIAYYFCATWIGRGNHGYAPSA